MVFGHIVQLDEDPRTWVEFLRKAASGSVKAADWLSSADMAIAERLGGRRLVDEAQLSEHEDVMSRALPDTPPFRDVPTLLAAARGDRVPAGVAVRATPYHPHVHYDRLWERKVDVVPAVLLHDAASFCLGRWDRTAFREVVNRAGDAGAGYNSQDAVAAMLYLSAIPVRLTGPRVDD